VNISNLPDEYPGIQTEIILGASPLQRF